MRNVSPPLVLAALPLVVLALDATRRSAARAVAHLVHRASAVTVARRSGARPPAALCVGHRGRGRPVTLPIGLGAAGHTLVVGATGSGKTVTQATIAREAIAQGQAAIVVDPKGDPYLREALAGAALVHHRAFLEWTPQGPCAYNPYARGTPTEIADRVLAAERWSEPHYLRQAQRYLGHAVRALRLAGESVSPASVLGHLDPLRLEILARRIAEAEAAPLLAYLDSLTARQERDLAGTRDRLAVMVESDLGAWLEPSGAGEAIDLGQSIEWGAVVYLALESDRRPLAAAMLAAAVVSDLVSVAGLHQTRRAPAVVVLDEFAAVASEQVGRLFARGRSAGLSLVLGTQELSDLRLPGAPGLLGSVLGNIAALVAHRQAVPESAELVAAFAGTRETVRTTVSRSGRGSATVSRTAAREFRLHPEAVRDLPAGVAAVIGSARRPVLARIHRS